MTAHGARRGNLIYHWKHGWIPLDHFAALSKGHHSRSQAVKVMQKHGIEVPHGYLGAGHHGAPKLAKAEARVTVEHSGDGTILHFGRDDMQAREAAKAVGARWSRNLGAWYLPRNQTESTRRMKVAQLQSKLGDSVHVSDGGIGATTTAAERESAKVSRAANRADRMDARAAKLAAESEARHNAARAIGDNIPFGQPILLGHHSQRRAERDAERIRSNYHKSFEAAAESKAAAQAADRARATAAGDTPLLRQRRIDRNEATIRKIDREIKDHELASKIPADSPLAGRVAYLKRSQDRLDQLKTARAELADQVAHDKAQIEASGFKGVNPADVQAGDMIQYRGRTHIVTKVNKTTFSVPTPYSWEDKVPINQVTKHIPLSTQSDGALESAYKNAKNPKVKGAIAREMKKRGMTIPVAS